MLGVCWVRSFIIEKVRYIKIVVVSVGIMMSMFYYLDLHQEYWCLRPVEDYYPLVEEKSDILLSG